MKASRARRRGATLPGGYDRLLLFGGGIVLSVSLIAAGAVSIAHRFDRGVDEWRAKFLMERDFVKSKVERSQARLRQVVEAYEALCDLHQQDPVPVERYRQLLEQQNGVVVTDNDITAEPFTILSTLTRAEDRPRLADLLRLIREIPSGSLLYLPGVTHDAQGRHTGASVAGFLYTDDRRFFATWPPRGATLDAARNVGTGALIERYVANVDAELRKQGDEPLREQRVFWVSLYDSDVYGVSVKHYAAPIYRGKERIAVLVVTVPSAQFPRLFHPAVKDPDFFVVSRDRRHVLGLDPSNPRAARWTQVASTGLFDAADERVQLIRRGREFFVMQRIVGPSWVAVHAFDWRTIVANLGESVSLTVTLVGVLLIVQWTFVILIDRLVLKPLRARARQVFESEAFNRTVLATAPVGLTVFDPATQRVVMQNGIARAMLSASPDEVGLYRRLLEGRRRGCRDKRRSASRRRGSGMLPRQVLTDDVSVATPDGRRRTLSVAFAHARYRQQRVVLFSLTDISRQKETMRLLRRARQTADDANRAKSMLVATISHEIRTPLSGALGNLELLSAEPLAPAQAARVDTVRRAFDTVLMLVDDVLDLTKVEVRELRLQIAPFRLDEVIERCAQTFAPAITAKGVRFVCAIDPRLAGWWRGDHHRVAQVLANLVGNACKFTRRGAIVVRAALSTDDAREVVEIAVEDTGIGIAAHCQAHIFEPFEQADGSIARRFGGSGLGLSLCRRLVELMGGRVGVRSMEGRGSTLTVRLPLERAGKAADDECVPSPPAFDTIVVACEHEAWHTAMLAWAHSRFPATTIVDGLVEQPVIAPKARTVALFGAHDDVLPSAWQTWRATCIDALVVSERGPLHPQRRGEAWHVTAFSVDKLALALTACGVAEALPGAPTPRRLPQAQPEHRRARILVVDDDPVNRALLAHQLEALGYAHVDCASDGLEALNVLIRNPYDLVVADLCMPVMDGAALVAALREQGIGVPVLANTAASCDASQAKREGFVEVLRKPVSIERLRLALEALFGSVPPRVADDVSVTDAMRAAFAASWRADAVALQQAIGQADADALERCLHRVKGALLVLGEREASQCCEDWRIHLGKHGFADAGQWLASLQALLAHLTGGAPPPPAAA
ncbi:hybrid sensor histidine kinase/response regulator [Trinickia fusca]|uniref:Virulence sensor protein BvgS n=1 Tax=Trinickia fusca TaxID=2419777 RepID=A0A494X0U4_9BURK|nr:hybrid sensor histidine kinase/response regulator [Trinickia fusca]RKP44337.1 sensor histidine kinase [Trinickia fusca]